MQKLKKWQIAIISIALILVLVGITAMVLLLPLKGKNNKYAWTDKDNFTELYNSTNSVIFKIEKEADKDFKILQLTDMQLWSNSKDNKETFEMCSRLIEKEKPNLIVLSGDNVSGITVPYLLKKVIKFFESKANEYNFYWTVCFGNHDNEIKATPNWSADQYEKVNVYNGGRCLFSKGPNNLDQTVGNFVINIMQGEEIVQSVYMLDNSQYIDYPQDMYDHFGRSNRERYITYKQIDWYEWNATNINKIAGKKVPSIVFTHFAMCEARDAYEKMVAGGDGILNTEDDLQKDESGRYAVPSDLGIGHYMYAPGTPIINTGFIAIAKELGMHTAMFGHDHENSGVVFYEGVTYGYGLKAGPSPKPWNYTVEFGGTSISIKADLSNANNPTITHVVDKLAIDYWN